MEEYLKVIFLAAPGFIAQRTAFWFGNGTSGKSIFDSVMTYVVYSLVCIPLGLFVISWLNIYPDICLDANSSKLLQVDPTLRQIAYTAACIIAVSFLFGFLWQILFKNSIKKVIEITSLKWQHFIPVSDEMFLEEYFKNLNKPALIAIKKDGRQIMKGAYLGSSFDDAIPVINVDERSQQIEQWKEAGYEFAVHDRLYIPQYDMLIETFEVPDHFFGD